MSTMDYILLWVIVILLYASAVMKIKLAEKKQQPYTTFWKVQLFVFPTMMLAVLLLLYFGIRDWVIQGIFLGIIEEFICWCIRKKKS